VDHKSRLTAHGYIFQRRMGRQVMSRRTVGLMRGGRIKQVFYRRRLDLGSPEVGDDTVVALSLHEKPDTPRIFCDQAQIDLGPAPRIAELGGRPGAPSLCR